LTDTRAGWREVCVSAGRQKNAHEPAGDQLSIVRSYPAGEPPPL